MKSFLGRFDSVPDLLELDHLTVSGDVTFGRGVTLKVSRASVASEPAALITRSFCEL